MRRSGINGGEYKLVDVVSNYSEHNSSGPDERTGTTLKTTAVPNTYRFQTHNTQARHITTISLIQNLDEVRLICPSISTHARTEKNRAIVVMSDHLNTFSTGRAAQASGPRISLMRV